MMPKKIPSKTEKRIKESQEWLFLIAFGKQFERVVVGKEIKPIDIVDGRCYSCLGPVGKLHVIGCLEEWQLCCGQLAKNCDCEYFSEEYLNY
jgi:hypothetical protein